MKVRRRTLLRLERWANRVIIVAMLIIVIWQFTWLRKLRREVDSMMNAIYWLQILNDPDPAPTPASDKRERPDVRTF